MPQLILYHNKPNNTMNKDRLNELSKEITAWSRTNFPDPSSEAGYGRLGLFEEIGEISRALLKHKQGIRGYKDPTKFKEDLTDALADCAIYTLDNMGRVEIEFYEDIQSYTSQEDDLDAIAGLCQQSIRIAHKRNNLGAHAALITELQMLGDCYNINLMEAIETTWAKVQKRNWKDNPEHAATLVEETAK